MWRKFGRTYLPLTPPSFGMTRAAFLACLVLSVAGCVTAGGSGDADRDRAYVVVKNENLTAYTVFANGSRIGRVGPNTTQRIPLTGIATGAAVQFSARDGAGATISWNPTPVQPGGSIGLTIRYRPGAVRR